MKYFDNHCMHKALEFAMIAQQKGDIPIGAVIYDPKQKKIISSGYNSNNISYDPTAHAEIVAIRNACNVMNSKRLEGCHLYVTLEPCAMCAAAISYARIERLYFGGYDSKFGAVDSNIKIYQSNLSLYVPQVYSGILEKESISLLQKYFTNQRK